MACNEITLIGRENYLGLFFAFLKQFYIISHFGLLRVLRIRILKKNFIKILIYLLFDYERTNETEIKNYSLNMLLSDIWFRFRFHQSGDMLHQSIYQQKKNQKYEKKQ